MAPAPSAREPHDGTRRLTHLLPLLLATCTCPTGPSSSAIPLTDTELRAIPGRLLFTSDRHGQHDVFLLTPGGREVQLTDGPADEFPAAVLPDGRAALVVAARGEGAEHLEQLLRQPLAGGAAVPLTPARRRVRNPSLSPDGRTVFVETGVDTLGDIHRLALTGDDGAEVALTSNREGNFEPDVSPDGTRVAFVSSRHGDPEVYVMRVDGSGLQRLTAFHREDVSPRWSPDGQWLAFVSNREGRDRLYVVRPDGTGLRALTRDAPTGAESQPAWAPDSKRLAFVGRQPGARARVWVVGLDGKPAVPLTEGAHGDEMPAWAPDGRMLAFVSSRSGGGDLYLMRDDGTRVTRLTQSPGADWLPRWVPGHG